MEVKQSSLPGVLLIKTQKFGDDRGFFMESWNREAYANSGVDVDFVQSNVSRSAKGILRGLHFQHPRAQGKLVQVLEGEVYDVAVDIRKDSPHFGEWVGERLSAENGHQLYIPPGFAHGFLVTSKSALFSYLCTEVYVPQDDGGIIWNDPDIGIQWPESQPLLSQKDQNLPQLKDLYLG
ncbi:MAG: dTDP-4-dehydrorhamnose 3,5-epimerase [bacterium]